MGSIEKLGKRFIGIALFIAMGITGAQANTLSEVQVNAAKDGYAVVFKTDSAAEMKKNIISPNRMTIELKDVEAAVDLNTVYNDVANIDNVTIQPLSKNVLRITLQGKNISSGKIYFENPKSVSAPAAKSTKASNARGADTIELSGPVTSYKPVYNPKNYEVPEVDQTANPKVNEILTKMNIDRAMVVSVKGFIKKAVNSVGDTNMAIAIGVFVLVAALLFRPKKKQAPAQVGLSGGMRQMDREVTLNKKLLAQKVSGASGRSVPSLNYGMKAYQQSQKNPYMTSNMAEHRVETPSVDHSVGVSGIPRKPVSPKYTTPVVPKTVKQAPPAMRPNIQPQMSALAAAMPQMAKMQSGMANSIQSELPSQMPAQAGNSIDSVKFLESITKIYEKNGRTDLAKGLKDNLKKTQMVKQAV